MHRATTLACDATTCTCKYQLAQLVFDFLATHALNYSRKRDLYVFVGAIEITHDFVGATTIALDSIGATTTTLDLLSILSG